MMKSNEVDDGGLSKIPMKVIVAGSIKCNNCKKYFIGFKQQYFTVIHWFPNINLNAKVTRNFCSFGCLAEFTGTKSSFGEDEGSVKLPL